MGLPRLTPDMRHEIVGDTARATPLAAYLVTMLNGVDWPAVAAMLAAIYTLILILEKAWKFFIAPHLAKKLAGTGAADVQGGG